MVRTPSSAADQSPIERLLAEILAGTGGLEDAACRGHHELFDPRDHDRNETPEQAHVRHTAAAAICQACPVLDRCTIWAEGESTHAALGVLAAVVPHTDGREDAA